MVTRKHIKKKVFPLTKFSLPELQAYFCGG